MRTHQTIAVLAAAGVLTLTGCSSDSTPATDKASAPSPTASSTPVTPSIDPSALAAAASAAGIPPSPAPAQRAAYLAALNKIDPEIVNGKDDKAVSRGLSQCQTMKSEKDPAKRVASANRRFLGPTHPDGFGTTKSTLIVAAVQVNLCPTY
ncbi:hypothetical protein AB0P15_36185 [Streptomyces sp. NPDC087917]|uniref:DUF732 domain-containing protein n=1 Tax=Streptomyces sp. NPDC087917 TaxID=3155060 RepID=UPI003443F847